jgi:hypothetical protein
MGDKRFNLLSSAPEREANHLTQVHRHGRRIEVADRQTLGRNRRTQDKRQLGRSILAVPEGDRQNPGRELILHCGIDRFWAISAQLVVGDSAFRA